MRPLVRREPPPNVLDGRSPRVRAAMLLTSFNVEQAERIAQTGLIDVVMLGTRALSPERRGNRKGRG